MKTKLFSLLLLIATLNLSAQNELPVLHTNTSALSIKDGPKLRKGYWHVSPDIPLDVYEADKISKVKEVTFYSDIDSISFRLKPNEVYDFVILLNGKDTCMTRLMSGVTYQEDPLAVATKDTIPFTLTAHNNIIIQAVLNESDTLDLMFHTAVNSISLTEEATRRIRSSKTSKSMKIKSWGGERLAEYTVGNELQIGRFNWDKLAVWTNQKSGYFSDGKFGPNLFENKIVELNFDDKILVVHSKLPDVKPGFQQFDLIFEQSAMLLNGVCKVGEEQFKNQFLIHSGFGGTLLLDDQFSSKHGLSEKLEINSESQLQDSNGNILKTKKAIMPGVQLESFEFDQVPMSFFEGSIGNQRWSVLGGELLKRFNILFDLQKAYIYLKPNELMNTPLKDV